MVDLPTALLWGADSTLLYNDTWIPAMGHRHPLGLARARGLDGGVGAGRSAARSGDGKGKPVIIFRFGVSGSPGSRKALGVQLKSFKSP